MTRWVKWECWCEACFFLFPSATREGLDPEQEAEACPRCESELIGFRRADERQAA